MSGWRYLICVSFLLTILLELTYQGPPVPASSSTKVSSGMREQSLGICDKISFLGGIWEGYSVCFFSPMTEKLEPEKRGTIC